jgi:23S rRNA pseudouridine2605 synthase
MLSTRSICIRNLSCILSKSISELVRLSKVIAATGVCSRREADKWITSGRVRVNYNDVSSVGEKISSKDKVFVDDVELRLKCKYERPIIWAVHKMRGELSTTSDPIKKRPLVFDRLTRLLREERNLHVVNKLEFSTEGLLLLTNSSRLAKSMESDDSGFLRKYRLRVHGKVTPSKLDGLQRGLFVNGIKYRYVISTRPICY